MTEVAKTIISGRTIAPYEGRRGVVGIDEDGNECSRVQLCTFCKNRYTNRYLLSENRQATVKVFFCDKPECEIRAGDIVPDCANNALFQLGDIIRAVRLDERGNYIYNKKIA